MIHIPLFIIRMGRWLIIVIIHNHIARKGETHSVIAWILIDERRVAERRFVGMGDCYWRCDDHDGGGDKIGADGFHGKMG